MVLFSEQRARALCCCFSGEYKVIDDHGGSSLFKNVAKSLFSRHRISGPTRKGSIGCGCPI